MASSSAQTLRPNLCCARCHVSEEHLGERLLNCGGCRSVQYCSKDCQSNDWSRHKATCRSIRRGASFEEAAPRSATRATMRMNLGQLDQLRDQLSGEGSGNDVSWTGQSRRVMQDVDRCGCADTEASKQKMIAQSTTFTPRRRIFTTSASRDHTTLSMRSHSR